MEHLINIQDEYLLIINDSISDGDYFKFITVLEEFFVRHDTSSYELEEFTKRFFNNVKVYDMDNVHKV